MTPLLAARAACRTPRGQRAAAQTFTVADGLAAQTFAKVFCGRCPIRDACLEAAMDGRETSGVWGGLTPAQRTLLAAQGWQTCPRCGRRYAPRQRNQWTCRPACTRALERARKEEAA